MQFQALAPGSPFFHQHDLTSLNLDHNMIMFIDSADCLAGLYNLHHLSLRGNLLQVLKGEYKSFDGLSNLETLDLSHNKLTWITPDVFVPLKSLLTLKLDYNNLQGNYFIVPNRLKILCLIAAYTSMGYYK